MLLAASELLGSPLSGADVALQDWMLAQRGGTAISVAHAITTTGSSPLLIPLVTAGGVLARWRTGRWWPGAAAVTVVVLGVLSPLGLSLLVGDARPPAAQWAVPVHGYAFPSGHTTSSALVAGARMYLVVVLSPSRRLRLAAAAVLGTWTLLVGLSRVYLAVHWITDVLGGWLLAGAWLAALQAGTARWGRTRRWQCRPGGG